MPYSSPSTQATGQVGTAAYANSLKAATDFLANPPACRVYHNTTQSCGDALETIVAFNSERWDTDTMHDTATNNTRITLKTAGLYIVTFGGNLAAAADYNAFYAFFRINGATRIITESDNNTTISFAPTFTLATVYKFAANDYVEVGVYQDNAANVARNLLSSANLSPEFSATWIGLG